MKSAQRNPDRPLRAIFMGTAEIACPSLRALIEAPGVDVVGVVTQPERPRGRGRQPRPSAVCSSLNDPTIRQWTPACVNGAEIIDAIRQAAPDIIVVMAYGQFLSETLLNLPPLGCINVHLSLLPRYRGAAPIQWAIANGERETGITIMRMVRRMDAGDILDQIPMAIHPDDTAESLAARLSQAAPPRLLAVLEALASGRSVARPQDERQATYAPMLKKEDGIIDWTLAADVIERRIRAFTPWPGCTTHINGRRLRILRAEVGAVSPPTDAAIPGAVVDVDSPGPWIQTGAGRLRLLAVQPEGRRAMSGHAFMCGHRLQPGAVLG